MAIYYIMRAVDNNAATTPPTYRVWTVPNTPDYTASQYSGPYSGTGMSFGQANILKIQNITENTRVPIDSNTLLCWAFDESVDPYKNTGTAGSLDFNKHGSAVLASREGVFGKALSVVSTDGLITSNTSLGETSGSITMSCWIYLRSYVTSIWSKLITKAYRNDGTWTSPYFSVCMQCINTADGQLDFAVAVHGAITPVQITAASDRVALNKWTFLAFTYDNSTGLLSAYKDGDLVNTATGGNIDWNTHGPWSIACNPTGAELFDGLIDDIRVEDVVRSQSYIQNMYRLGIGSVGKQ